MTVLQIIAAPTAVAGGQIGITGPERRALNLLRHWRDVGVRVAICYPRRGRLWRDFEAADVPLVDFEIGSKLNFAAVSRIAAIARDLNADIIHTQGPPSLDMLALFAARRSGCGLVVTRPSMIEDQVSYSRLRRGVYALADRLTSLRSADAVIAVSRHGLGHLQSRTPRSDARLRLIPNGIDLSAYSPRAPSQSDGTSAQPSVVLGMVGHLRADKGWPDFIEIVRRLRGQGLNVRATALGDGEQRAELEALVEAAGLSGIVEFAGFRPDVAASLQSFDIFLFTSLREGLSVAIIEAMASGLPIVATEVGGIREQVAEGTNGNVLGARDVEGMTRACARLVRDPGLRAAMGREARRLAVEKFSEQRMLQDYVACYRAVAQGGADRNVLNSPTAAPGA